MTLHENGIRRRWKIYAGLFLGFQLMCAFVYRGALDGSFLSDDLVLILGNPYVKTGSITASLATFEPSSTGSDYMIGNYSPLAHVAHALQMRGFDQDVRLYHASSIAVHALNATLLVGLASGVGVPLIAAIGIGAIFALHPANVEVVAWISQLRTLLAMACCLVALLLFRRGMRRSTLFLGAGLLFKSSAASALLTAIALYVAQRIRGEDHLEQGRVLALWGIVFLVFAPIQISLFSDLGTNPVDPYPNLWVQLTDIAGFGARYLAMAFAGYGLSAYHAPALPMPFDAWTLAGFAIGIATAVWAVLLLRRGEAQAAFWIFAAAGFAPISQVIPFAFPMADRYLYFVLPGLLIGVALMGLPLWRKLEERLGGGPALHGLRGAAGALAVAACLAFGSQASARAEIWSGWEALYADSAVQYPDAAPAHYLRALVAMRGSDDEAAIDHLERYVAMDGHLNQPLETSPHFPGLGANPRYDALLDTSARRYVEVFDGSASIRRIAGVTVALIRLGDYDGAIARIEAALETAAEEDRAQLFTMLMNTKGARGAADRR